MTPRNRLKSGQRYQVSAVFLICRTIAEISITDRRKCLWKQSFDYRYRRPVGWNSGVRARQDNWRGKITNALQKYIRHESFFASRYRSTPVRFRFGSCSVLFGSCSVLLRFGCFPVACMTFDRAHELRCFGCLCVQSREPGSPLHPFVMVVGGILEPRPVIARIRVL